MQTITLQVPDKVQPEEIDFLQEFFVDENLLQQLIKDLQFGKILDQNQSTLKNTLPVDQLVL